MAQAKGILPRGDEREVLYRNPRACGYFIGLKLSADLDRAAVMRWLARVDDLVNAFVARGDSRPGEPKGPKLAAVAVGFAPSFFVRSGVSRWSPAVELPAGFPTDGVVSPLRSDVLRQVPLVDADVLLYVTSVHEARVMVLLSELAQLTELQGIVLERGYQREDGTEHFGYRDGVRNVMPRTERSRVVFVHRDGRELDEPAWADDGSYMAYLKIRQNLGAFRELSPEEQDAVIGRRRDGTRMDLVGVRPDAESAETPIRLPPSSHVRKAGPRGQHDDTQIFRRGLPYLEVSPEGKVEVGLQFCSFQATLDQFDVVFNDWCHGSDFPHPGAGPDALLAPDGGLTEVLHAGFFFVPPYVKGGLTAAIFGPGHQDRKSGMGRLVVHTRLLDPTDPNRRLERRGFQFQILDESGLSVGDPFGSDRTGRAVFDGELRIGETYTLREIVSPVPNVTVAMDHRFTMEKANQRLSITRTITEPNNAYESA